MTLSTTTPAHAIRTYETTAPFYDELTAHHDYGLWLGNLLAALRVCGLVEGQLLDVACGTGKSFLHMLSWGWSVTAVDGSPAMLSEAVGKAGDRARLELADMRCLPALGSFQLVWCLDDALNCLRDDTELEQALAGMAANLAPEGLLLFDVNTLLTYRGFFAADETVEGSEGKILEWRGLTSSFAPSGCLASARFSVRDADGAVLASAVHEQRHFPIATVISALEKAGLEPLSICGHSTDAALQPLDEERHTKVIVIARAKEGR